MQTDDSGIGMRLYRLIAILLLIESRGQVKARDLARALETSERTIYRDIETLCQAGMPIAATAGPKGGIRFMEGYSTKLYHLRDEDAVNLYLSGTGLFNDAAQGTSELKNTLARLERYLPQEYQADIRAARERFFFDEEPWWGDRPLTPCLAELRRAVWSSQKLRVVYTKPSGQVSVRIVRPYGLVLKSMQWYLVAYCEKSYGVRTFKGDRIMKAEPLAETFMLPDGFQLELYWKNGLSAFKAERRAAEQYPVKIRLAKRDRWILDELEIYDIYEDSDEITATVNMHKLDFAQTEALAIALQAEILSPPGVREFVARSVTEMAERYHKKIDP